MADLLRAYIGRRIVAQVDVGTSTDTIVGTLRALTGTEMEVTGAELLTNVPNGTATERGNVDGVQVLRRDRVAWVQVLP